MTRKPKTTLNLKQREQYWELETFRVLRARNIQTALPIYRKRNIQSALRIYRRLNIWFDDEVAKWFSSKLVP
jgi:hypothetical protein